MIPPSPNPPDEDELEPPTELETPPIAIIQMFFVMEPTTEHRLPDMQETPPGELPWGQKPQLLTGLGSPGIEQGVFRQRNA